jgi:pentapeptide MXKDX repeat protein
MRTILSVIATGVVGLGVSVALVGCGAPPNTAKDKMSGDKMGSKMEGDRMGGDKMGDKMGEKMSEKMSEKKDKMEGDKK